MRNRLVIAGALVLFAGVSLTACRQNPQTPPAAKGPLPPPPSGELKYVGSLPAHPYAKQTGNYFLRTVYETDGPGNSHIEVRDVLVPPHTKSAISALPGPAVIEAAIGDPIVTVDNKPEKLPVGAMRQLPSGKDVQFENTGARPAIIRLYVIRGR